MSTCRRSTPTWSQLPRILTPEGVAFIHHSNLGAYPASFRRLAHTPKVAGMLRRLGVIEYLHIRDPTVSAEHVAAFAAGLGLKCIGQEITTWLTRRTWIDCMSTIVRADGPHAGENRIMRNRRFRREAAYLKDLSTLYGPERPRPDGAPERVAGASEVTIACTFDDAWAPQFATCATTIAASRGAEHVHLIILGGPTLTARTTAAVGAYLRDLGLSWELLTPSDQALRALPEAGMFSPLVWYRTLLPTLLPEHDRVLSLDVDTLVLQSLSPLFERDLGDNLLAAVAAAPGPAPHFRVPFAGLAPLKYSFNAGVMLLNLEAMRDAETGPRAIALGREKGDRLIFAEQDALNHLARARWDMLHPKWNGLSYLWMAPGFADDAYTELERATARAAPVVIHFEGGPVIKPWYFRCSHPLRHLYREYRAQTPWPLQRLENVSPVGAVLRRMPFTWQCALIRSKTAWVDGLGRPASVPGWVGGDARGGSTARSADNLAR